MSKAVRQPDKFIKWFKEASWGKRILFGWTASCPLTGFVYVGREARATEPGEIFDGQKASQAFVTGYVAASTFPIWAPVDLYHLLASQEINVE